MNILKKYIDQNNVTKYQISKLSGISQMTLSHATADTKQLSNQTVKVISAVAQALGKTPRQVLDDLIKLENSEG
ncbi:helix-turn-helix domain-containing protein [Lactobacillus delbrueckii]|uniref:helix-turn-helix domain-containing protein n=1 Tax=Lactobacillus delbrueckii TaxID=1584 RepID=UPI0037C5A0D4